MVKNSIPKVSEKNTKTEILEAYSKAIRELEARATTKVDLAEESSRRAEKTLVEKVESVSIETVTMSLDAFSTHLEKLELELNVLSDINSAIKIKKAELKEVFDIEKNAYTLAALVNSQSEIRENFEKEMNEKRSTLDKLLSDTMSQITEKKLEFSAEQNKVIAELKEVRKKDETEYNYNFSRLKKIAEDNFQDEMTKKRKELEEEVEQSKKDITEKVRAVELKLSEIALMEKEFADMHEKINQFPAILETAVKEAEKKGKDAASQSYAFETRYIKKENEGTIALLESKLEAAATLLNDEKEKSKALAARLDEAYTRLETLAAKTVDGASSAKLVSTLETALREKSTNSGK